MRRKNIMARKEVAKREEETEEELTADFSEIADGLDSMSE